MTEKLTIDELAERYSRSYAADLKAGQPIRSTANHFAIAVLYSRTGRFTCRNGLYHVPEYSDLHSSKLKAKESP